MSTEQRQVSFGSWGLTCNWRRQWITPLQMSFREETQTFLSSFINVKLTSHIRIFKFNVSKSSRNIIEKMHKNLQLYLHGNSHNGCQRFKIQGWSTCEHHGKLLIALQWLSENHYFFPKVHSRETGGEKVTLPLWVQAQETF